MKEITDDNLTLEDIGRKGYKLYQIKDGFRFGTDTVLLSWFTASFIKPSSRKSYKCLELGSNCGGAGICLLARRDNILLDETEITTESYQVLNKNIKLNNLENSVRTFNCDIRDLPSEVKNNQYDIVFMNPPFFNRSRGIATTKSETKLAGKFEENGGLDDFVKVASARVVPSSGFVTMVMHGDRLGESINSFIKNGLTPTHLINVHSFEQKNACMILLAGRKGVKSDELKVLPPLILNKGIDENGVIIASDKTTQIYEGEHIDCFI